MAQRLYIGNLPYTITEEELKALFSQHGTVTSVNVIMDRETGRPRGFAFVEMEDGAAAIRSLDGQEYGGRNLRVNEARERSEGGGAGGGYGGGRGGYGGGGGRPRGGRW